MGSYYKVQLREELKYLLDFWNNRAGKSESQRERGLNFRRDQGVSLRHDV